MAQNDLRWLEITKDGSKGLKFAQKASTLPEIAS